MRQERDISFDDRLGAHFGKSKPITRAEMLAKVFRFRQLPSSENAFIDSALPEHQRVMMGVIGAGTAEENLSSQVSVAENYHVDLVKAGPGKGAALHSHDSEETFICLTGRWRVSWGDEGEESVELNYLDGIWVPAGVMRAFENTSNDEALLLAILGGKTPGHVVWAESIKDKLLKARA